MMKLRRARPEDAAHFVRVKEALPMPQAFEEAVSDGFLLGTSEVTYREYIDSSHCIVAMDGDDAVVGFGIVFPDAVLRASEVWEKRGAADWKTPPSSFEDKRLCYFEQLAFLPGYKRAAIGTAYRLVHDSFVGSGAEVLVTTTVREPVLNRAALPFIAAAGGIHAGAIEEEYPLVGRILSDIHLIRREDFLARTPQHPLQPLFEKARLQKL